MLKMAAPVNRNRLIVVISFSFLLIFFFYSSSKSDVKTKSESVPVKEENTNPPKYSISDMNKLVDPKNALVEEFDDHHDIAINQVLNKQNDHQNMFEVEKSKAELEHALMGLKADYQVKLKEMEGKYEDMLKEKEDLLALRNHQVEEFEELYKKLSEATNLPASVSKLLGMEIFFSILYSEKMEHLNNPSKPTASVDSKDLIVTESTVSTDRKTVTEHVGESPSKPTVSVDSKDSIVSESTVLTADRKTVTEHVEENSSIPTVSVVSKDSTVSESTVFTTDGKTVTEHLKENSSKPTVSVDSKVSGAIVPTSDQLSQKTGNISSNAEVELKKVNSESKIINKIESSSSLEAKMVNIKEKSSSNSEIEKSSVELIDSTTHIAPSGPVSLSDEKLKSDDNNNDENGDDQE